MKPIYLLPLLAACQITTGAVTVAAPVPVSGTPSGDTTARATPAPSSTPVPTVTLRYWMLTAIDNPLGLSTAISLTGYCTEFNGGVYCWDDGVKTQTHYYGLQQATFYYTFWGLTYRVAAWDLCHGLCQTDMMLEPVLMTNLANYALYAQATPAEIMRDGEMREAVCTRQGDTLECGAFSIDLARIAP